MPDDARELAYQTLGSANPFPALEPDQIGYLELLSSPDPRIAPTVVPLAHTRVRLGRFSPAGTYATTSDVFVAVCDEATAISPMNTMFEYIGGEFHAFDTRSAHGTYVNGEQIFKRRKLAYGDVIEIGGIADAAGERRGGARVRFLGTTPPSGHAIRNAPVATTHTWKSARGHLVVELDLVAGSALAKVAIEYADWRGAALAAAHRVTAVRAPSLPPSEVDRDDPSAVRYRAGGPLTPLPTGRVLELREAFLIVADLCDAAAACHRAPGKPTLLGPFERGLVWRGPSGDAVVFAAGVSREVHAFERGLTGRAMFARHFRRSPEEIDGLPTTPATDVFFAAYFLIELLTGREPYPTDASVYWDAVTQGEPQLPASMPSTIARAFSPDPTARPSLAAFVATLRA